MSEVQFRDYHKGDEFYTNPITWSRGKVIWVKNKLEDPWFECRFHHYSEGKVFAFLPRENSSRNIDFKYVTAENMLGKELLSIEQIL